MSDAQPALAGSDRTLVVLTGWGFAVGSLLFVVGVPLSLMASDSAPVVSGWTFFAGSVFFTSAATLQVTTSWRTVRRERAAGTASAYDSAELTASWVQWIGTVAFNVTTLRAAVEATGAADPSTAAIWRPDAVGSILFLVSSAIALVPEVRKHRHGHARDRSWAIAAANMVGSVLFGISAVGAFTSRSTGDLVSLSWDDWGCALGGVCFLIGALLLLPRRAS